MTDREIRDLLQRHFDRDVTDEDVATFRRHLDEYTANYLQHLTDYNETMVKYR